MTADLNALVDYVNKLPASNGKTVVGGFCWGGGEAFRLATNNAQLKAAFVFYGTGPNNEADASRIAAPVYGFYAGNDARSAHGPWCDWRRPPGGAVLDRAGERRPDHRVRRQESPPR